MARLPEPARSVPTTPDEHYFDSLERAMNFTVPRPSVLVVNYPSNPTAEAVDLAFYERLVTWAKENKVWIISDLAYSELYFDGKPTPSILQVKGAKDVAIEFTSLSKTYTMAGWRIGFAVGNPRLIAALKAQGAEDIIVICGGVIPQQDYDFLRQAGVAAIFGPGTNIPVAAREILDIVRASRV